jgi:hypothetical protein
MVVSIKWAIYPRQEARAPSIDKPVAVGVRQGRPGLSPYNRPKIYHNVTLDRIHIVNL